MTQPLGGVEITPPAPTQVLVSTVENTVVVTQNQTLVSVTTEGPKEVIGGPLESLSNVDTSGKVDGSVIYYDEGTDKYRADSVATLITLTDGGNF